MLDKLRITAVAGALMLAASSTNAATRSLWHDVEVTATDTASSSTRRSALPSRYRLLDLDLETFRQSLGTTRMQSLGRRTAAGWMVALPLPEGGFREFVIESNDVVPAGLAKRHPELRTFSGYARSDPTMTLRLDLTAAGLHAMVSDPAGVFLIDPYEPGQVRRYLSFRKADAPRPARSAVATDYVDNPDFRREMAAIASDQPNGSTARAGRTTRTYRIAVATTGEYAQYHGGTVPLALAAVVTAINRVGGIYEQELSVKLQLIEDNDRIIFTDPAEDPYSNFDPYALLSQNQYTLDKLLGEDQYDVGHVFSTGGGGLAYVGVVCGNWRARGETGLSAPDGDAFWVDYVAHELGHQFGADHTFNSPLGYCQGNRTSSSAFEIGSGSTIMGYAGVCGDDDLQKHSDPYFHSHSYDQIRSFVMFGGGAECGKVKATGNSPPVPRAGKSGLTIPMLTPFMLIGSGIDADEDPLTFSWEQYDLGNEASIAQTMNPDRVPSGVPLFRAFSPVDAPQRVFPDYSSLLSGAVSWGEVLPAEARELNFRLIARDGRGGIGVSAVRTIEVTDKAGPFAVTTPNGGEKWQSDERTEEVRWDVARTDEDPVGCTRVDILLSVNGGRTFEYTLASRVVNDGLAVVDIPAESTERGRLLVSCTNNVFFDVSDADFAILAPSGGRHPKDLPSVPPVRAGGRPAMN
ncbi:MAG: M12 family metallo-peptidase [Methylotetracoccus sp.]